MLLVILGIGLIILTFGLMLMGDKSNDSLKTMMMMQMMSGGQAK